MVDGEDLVWMANFMGGVDWKIAAGVPRKDSGKELIIGKDGQYSYNFQLRIYRIPEKQSEELMVLPGLYACVVDLDSRSYEKFVEGEPSPDNWFYDNQWPVYLNGEPAPYYDWMDDAKDAVEEYGFAVSRGSDWDN